MEFSIWVPSVLKYLQSVLVVCFLIHRVYMRDTCYGFSIVLKNIFYHKENDKTSHWRNRSRWDVDDPCWTVQYVIYINIDSIAAISKFLSIDIFEITFSRIKKMFSQIFTKLLIKSIFDKCWYRNITFSLRRSKIFSVILINLSGRNYFIKQCRKR